MAEPIDVSRTVVMDLTCPLCGHRTAYATVDTQYELAVAVAGQPAGVRMADAVTVRIRCASCASEQVFPDLKVMAEPPWSSQFPSDGEG